MAMSDMSLKDLNSLANRLVRVPVRMDCFFVTLAFLLRTTVEDISARINIPVPAPGSTGVNIGDIINALTRLGMVFNVWNYQEDPAGNGGPIRGGAVANNLGLAETAVHGAVGMPRVVGAVYLRPDRTGHVVVCRNPGTPYRRYIDYQASRAGTDATRDAQNSRIVAYFALDTDRTTGGVNNDQRQGIEQMEVDEERAHPDEPMEVDDADSNRTKPGPSGSGKKHHEHDELRRARARRFRRF
ncbi:hypothetical protein Dda_7151 [Drechslerella dactyloides]|uniref:Uncharacterized protein n=1 Tax=Drechslerella dactyloides TaxID=74499 RepID=A0AAD6NHD6_DREDA|nr:hypothetical protein Dda_7151 [Drechslerella dactyloides]